MASSAECASYHALNSATASNYSRLSGLLSSLGSWEAAWDSYARGENPGFSREEKWERLKSLKLQLVLKGDPYYPKCLAEIPLPPHALYIKGDADVLLSDFSFAVVGTRRASDTGRETAREFAQGLAGAGACIVSGLAFGIDEVGHRGALSAGGKTIAVLASGLDRVTPQSQERLAEDIMARGGALVSEIAPGTPIFSYSFLQRNRIISGLSRGVLVVELPEKSGAAVTARFAMEQNRDVFVVPGGIQDFRYAGSNRLIQTGAELVISPEDILSFYGRVLPPAAPTRRRPGVPGSGPEDQILSALHRASTPLCIDKIAEVTTLNIQTVSRVLTFLILSHAVKENGQGFFV